MPEDSPELEFLRAPVAAQQREGQNMSSLGSHHSAYRRSAPLRETDHATLRCPCWGGSLMCAVGLLQESKAKIVSLDLGQNNMTEKGAAALAEYLQGNENIEELLVNMNDIGNGGMYKVFCVDISTAL